MGGISGSQSALMPARAGVARAGGYRAGYFAQTSAGIWATNVVVLINGVDVSQYVSRRDQPMSIAQVINDQPDTARFSLKPVALPFTPKAQQLVTIAFGDAGNPEFAGQILRVQRRYVRGITMPLIDVDCIDFSRLFDRRVVSQHWSNTSATQIAGDIVDLWTTGFTRASIAARLPTIDDFSATNEAPTSLLRRLANLIDGAFYIDARRDVHLFGVAGDLAPKAGTNPLTITISPVLKSFKGEQFTYEEDASQIRTRSIVEGKSTTCPVSTPSGATSVVVSASASVDYLVGAGGAGGGGSTGNGNGGGGAGAVLTGTDTVSSGSFPIVVGAGGAAATNGSDSSWNGHTATGGGKGASGPGNGTAGGSGGGAGSSDSGGGSGGAGSTGGNAGGGAVPGNGAGVAGSGGGGGGATGPGVGGAFPGASANGGQGLTSAIDGTSRVYGSGGGGGAPGGQSAGAGGTGAGNGGSGAAGGNATGYCSGGGGAGDNATGGTGFHGRVVLSYPVGALLATGGTITTVGGRTIHTLDANDTFVMSTVTLTAPAPVVTDIPLNDASQIDVNPGFVRIGTQVFSYLSTGGAVVAAGANPPGSSLSADAAMFATSISIVDSSPFTAAPGWAKVGDQIVRFSGISAGALTGIPSIGFGSLAAAVKSGTSVTWLGHLNLSVSGVTFSPPLAAGDAVIQRVIADDAVAQSMIAALEGGDGVHEQPVSDGRLGITGATNRAHAELADFSTPITPISWDTEDMNARPGRTQAVAIDEINVTLVITKSDISFPTPNGLPRRQCEASTVHMAALLDAVVTAPN
jgi:hypothetical protein